MHAPIPVLAPGSMHLHGLWSSDSLPFFWSAFRDLRKNVIAQWRNLPSIIACAFTRGLEIGPLHPSSYTAVPVLLVAAAVLASYVPACKAAVIYPIEALKTE